MPEGQNCRILTQNPNTSDFVSLKSSLYIQYNVTVGKAGLEVAGNRACGEGKGGGGRES